jgi:hypothetical protein
VEYFSPNVSIAVVPVLQRENMNSREKKRSLTVKAHLFGDIKHVTAKITCRPKRRGEKKMIKQELAYSFKGAIIGTTEAESLNMSAILLMTLLVRSTLAWLVCH